MIITGKPMILVIGLRYDAGISGYACKEEDRTDIKSASGYTAFAVRKLRVNTFQSYF